MLVVSLHQWPFYPGGGGPGRADESTLNVPLTAGSGDGEYREGVSRRVEPAVEAFDPELLLVSAGFDAHVEDPLAEMAVTGRASRSSRVARRSSGLACGAVLEGGYNLATLPRLVDAALTGFAAA